MSATPDLDWNELDDKAVDTVRVLAMDAVQKVGNGHPGTAMSLAPAAYLLFQKVMRHNPADPHWPGRDRFVLSAGHSSLTLYLQLFLGGWGLELEDIKALRTWGSKTPGHPEYGHTAGVETTTGPLGQGIGNAVGMAMAARTERGLLDPDATTGDSPFDHQIYAICSDGDIEEGVSAEASAIAGVQQLGNLTVIYDANRISIEDNTDIALAEDVGKRYEAYGWHVQTVDWTNDETEYVEDVPELAAALQAAREVTDRPSFIVLRTIIAWPAPDAQNTGKAHGSALGEEEVAATKKVLGFDPDQTFEVQPGVLEHTRELVTRGKEAQQAWQAEFDAWAADHPDQRALYDRMQTRTLPDGWADDLPVVRRRPQGRGHPQGQRPGDQRDRREGAGVLGRLGRPGRVQQHHHRGRSVVPARRPLDQDVAGRPLRRPGAPLRHPRARHGRDPQRHRRARRHPRLRRHLPHVLRLHATVGPAGLDHGAPGHLRLDPRLDRARRGRSDPPADRALRRAPGDPGARRRPPGRRQRGRRVLEGRSCATPTGRPGWP